MNEHIGGNNIILPFSFKEFIIVYVIIMIVVTGYLLYLYHLDNEKEV